MNKLKYSEMFYSIQGEGRYVGVPSVFLRLFGCNFECRGFGQDRDRSKWLPESQMAHNQNHPNVKTIKDLPVPHVGCDSSFSWGKKWGHLANNDDTETIIKKMDELTNWYGDKERTDGDLSVVLKQDDGVHLVITGGEPLLKGFQPAIWDLMTSPNLKTKFITFETNGTQIFTPNYLLDYMNKYGVGKNCGITWSVSPKLSNSGESFVDAIRPEALASYNEWPYSYLYLKFVVRDQYDIIEVEQALKEYDNARVNIDAVYLMPEGGTSDGMKLTENEVAQLALKHGYKYSPRLHINLFGNEWGT
jgi:organic radical activating enzyme